MYSVVRSDRVEADHVDDALPVGFVGRMAYRVRVRRQLEQIFDHRREAIARLFPAPVAS